jgi:hypothetical protein
MFMALGGFHDGREFRDSEVKEVEAVEREPGTRRRWKHD